VDFLHQFCRPVVPKEDKTLPRRPLRLRFGEPRGCLREVFSARRAFGSQAENALDLIRRVVSDRQPIPFFQA
jgi:hypothetical protein